MDYEKMAKIKAEHGLKNMTEEEKELAEEKIKKDWDNMNGLFKKRSNFRSYRALELQNIALKKFKTLKLDSRYDYEAMEKKKHR